MDSLTITYQMTLPDSTRVVYPLCFEEQSMMLHNNIPGSLPTWTALSFQQCSHCPLSPAVQNSCPLAANLVNIIVHFDRLMSYENIFLEVITKRRTISRETTVQDALSAIMGLVIPTSGCPHTGYFRPMARFHLPLADTAETIYRAASMYLLGQYFCKKAGMEVDLELDGLKKIYHNMQILNGAIAERLRAASKTDSSVNALILLDMFALAMPIAVEESLEELHHLFTAYLKE
jgi:hypothetical protein